MMVEQMHDAWIGNVYLACFDRSQWNFGFAVGYFIGHASACWAYRIGSRDLPNALDLYSDAKLRATRERIALVLNRRFRSSVLTGYCRF
jgi:hypothetical protein